MTQPKANGNVFFFDYVIKEMLNDAADKIWEKMRSLMRQFLLHKEPPIKSYRITKWDNNSKIYSVFL